MKVKVTNKELKDYYYYIISIGYCNAQYLLKALAPRFYTSGIYGWKADHYEIRPNLLISTGYAPLGNQNLPRTDKEVYEITKRYEKRAERINLKNDSWITIQKKLNTLLEKYIKEIMKEGNKYKNNN